MEPPPVTSPPPAKQNNRKRLILWGIGLCLMAVAGRLLLGYFSTKSEQNHSSFNADGKQYILQSITARPGDIVDRKGRLLATSISAQSLYLIPDKITSPQQTANKLSTLFDIDTDWVIHAIEKHDRCANKYLWLQRRLNRQQVQQVLTLGLPPEEYSFQKEYLRCYPQGKLATHLLGTQNLNGIGQGGIEESYSSFICGTNGKRIVVRNASGQEIPEEGRITTAPEHGKTFVLSIDSVIQQSVEEELQQAMSRWNAKGCCAIVMNPQTGEVLASASLPNYDPNQPAATTANAWRDQTISFLFEPNEMLYPLLIAGALDAGIVTKEELFRCQQSVLSNNQPLSNLSVADILSQSNRDGMVQITKRLQKKNIFNDVVTSFGFGKKTGCPLADEQTGTVSSHKQTMTVTPLQLIMAYSTLANNGNALPPRYLLKQVNAIEYIRDEMSVKTGSHHSATEQRKMGSRSIISSQHAKWLITKPMVNFVNTGAGKNGRIHGYTVFGNAGTSRKQTKAVCSYICGAPADQPELLVLVVVDEPAKRHSVTGTTVAAPIAAEILSHALQYLQVPSHFAKKDVADKPSPLKLKR